MSDLKVYFPDGTTGDLARLQREWGSGIQVLRSTATHKFELTAVNILTDGTTRLIVWGKNSAGQAATGTPCTYTYPTLESPSGDLPLLPATPATHWCARGVNNKNRIGGDGKIDFEIGSQSWTRDGRGPYSVFMLSPSCDSDCFVGAGWKMGTEHYGPCEFYFTEVTDVVVPDPTEPPTPPPPTTDDTDLAAIITRLDSIQAMVARIAGHFK